MITKFTTYINESRMSIDELEILTPDQLGELLIDEVREDSPDVQYIKDLLAVGCPIDASVDYYGWTPLHLAARRGYLEVVKLLISKGAEINVRNVDGYTPLERAVRNGHLEVVKFLISKGAQVDAMDHMGATAWDVAYPAFRGACPELNPNK